MIYFSYVYKLKKSDKGYHKDFTSRYMMRTLSNGLKYSYYYYSSIYQLLSAELDLITPDSDMLQRLLQQTYYIRGVEDVA